MVHSFLKADRVFPPANLRNINTYLIRFSKLKTESMKETKNFLGTCVGDLIIFDMFRTGPGIAFRL